MKRAVHNNRTLASRFPCKQVLCNAYQNFQQVVEAVLFTLRRVLYDDNQIPVPKAT